ncbi:hypothetical protein KUTeg_024987 [Tegillarca granosa]|uniref:Neurotransmitter-gated ion-channel transmembrane domain-containing protein n=1 Tax=Tegillarca granosa TaxID=220873 RepID=A0ABQ9E220_TEGGR|nr:hypothetical protein KUTeg_024987 [Tegillarca granosa]
MPGVDSFTTNQILLDWLKDKTYTSDEFVTAEEQPCIELTLTLKMDFTSYIIRIYIPSTLIVALGWLSMWLDKSQVGARTSLGVLCVVSILTQSLGVMVMLPNAEGLLAIDIWMGFCMMFATMALFLFALVHNLHRRRGKKSAVQQKYKEGSTDEENGKGNDDGPTCDILPATIQNTARVVYPILFIVFNIVYWALSVVLAITKRKYTSNKGEYSRFRDNDVDTILSPDFLCQQQELYTPGTEHPFFLTWGPLSKIKSPSNTCHDPW